MMVKVFRSRHGRGHMQHSSYMHPGSHSQLTWLPTSFYHSYWLTAAQLVMHTHRGCGSNRSQQHEGVVHASLG